MTTLEVLEKLGISGQAVFRKMILWGWVTSDDITISRHREFYYPAVGATVTANSTTAIKISYSTSAVSTMMLPKLHGNEINKARFNRAPTR